MSFYKPYWHVKKCIDGDAGAHIIALSCGEPLKDFAQWSLRLLAEKAVELEYVESQRLGYSTRTKWRICS